MNKYLIIMMCFLLFVFSAGCSKDTTVDDKDKNLADQAKCYTIHINGIDGRNIVSGSIINMPEGSSLVGHCIVFFDKNDLSEQEISDGDVLDIMIQSFKNVPVEGYTTGETNYYRTKVKPCK